MCSDVRKHFVLQTIWQGGTCVVHHCGTHCCCWGKCWSACSTYKHKGTRECIGSRLSYAAISSAKGLIRFIFPHAGCTKNPDFFYVARSHGRNVGTQISTPNHMQVLGFFLNDFTGTFNMHIANENNNHDLHLEKWTLGSSMGVAKRVRICHGDQHVP